MKRVFLCLLLAFTLLLASCGTGDAVMSEAPEALGSPSEESLPEEISEESAVSEAPELSEIPEISEISEVSSEESEPVVNKKQKIVFIGNSLTKASEMPKRLEILADGKYKTKDLSIDGAFLSQHINYIKAGDAYPHSKELADADIVVLQEYGGGRADDASLGGIVEEVRRVAGDGVQIYFMTTHVSYAYLPEGDEIDSMLVEQLKKYDGVKYLPAGLICQYVAKNYFGGNTDLFLYDGLHPSPLGAAFAAMAFQIIVDDADAPTGDWRFLPKEVMENIPGEDTAAKKEKIKEIYKAAHEYYVAQPMLRE